MKPVKRTTRFAIAASLAVGLAGAASGFDSVAVKAAGPGVQGRQQEQQQEQDRRAQQTEQKQTGQQPAGQRPTFRTGANYVRVDVYPTEDGKPVTDLTAQEFEVLEDGVPQRIEAFELVVAGAPVPQEMRVEPATAGEANRMAREARSRVFVLFLDTYHVSLASAGNIRKPLVRMLERLIGEDDLVAVMTPEMPASGITFARRTTTIDAMLEKWWEWARRSSFTGFDVEEERYMMCYPPTEGEAEMSSIARAMIERRRERMAFDAFESLVMHLEMLREERKAVVLVTEGWQLFRSDRRLADAGNLQKPGIYVGPGGKPAIGDDPRLGLGGISPAACDQARVDLALLDNETRFRALLNQANRANVSFYPVDPRGLAVFYSPIGPARPLPPDIDQKVLTFTIDTLRTLAENTDGIAIVEGNDFDRGLKRILDDLTSYYLLGYYSTNTKADGRYRRITVRVKRPGVQVRARNGYQALTQAELEARAALESAVGPPAPPSAPDLALSALAARRRDTPVRALSGYAWRSASPVGESRAGIWVIGELDQARARAPEWEEGGTASVTVTDSSGNTAASAEQPISRAARSFVLELPSGEGLPPGDYTVRVAWRGPLNATETFRITVPETEPGTTAVGTPILMRRGPFTGPGWQATADTHFRRQERLRVDLPVQTAPAGARARLLDRQGREMAVPVTAGERQENGVNYVTAELVLAPLAQGDYLIELMLPGPEGERKEVAAFRIVP